MDQTCICIHLSSHLITDEHSDKETKEQLETCKNIKTLKTKGKVSRPAKPETSLDEKCARPITFLCLIQTFLLLFRSNRLSWQKWFVINSGFVTHLYPWTLTRPINGSACGPLCVLALSLSLTAAECGVPPQVAMCTHTFPKPVGGSRSWTQNLASWGQQNNL